MLISATYYYFFFQNKSTNMRSLLYIFNYIYLIIQAKDFNGVKKAYDYYDSESGNHSILKIVFFDILIFLSLFVIAFHKFK